MTIQKVNQQGEVSIYTETWYIAQELVPTRHNTLAIATGYGTTHYNALIACMRDIQKINSLQ